ncbi:MAG: zinc ribbon domain-containing protein [Actinobacteria bacterium]|nr:zinc ribbon domain-containing protein [Actinomycetota bacterium]
MSSQLTMIMMLAVTLGAAIYVAWPLLFGKTRPEDYLGLESSEPVLQRLYFQRDATYSAMKELDFDLAMGNLSKQDHQQLQDRYKRKAVAILKRIDDAKAGRASRVGPNDDELEMAVPVKREPRKARAETSRVDLDVEQEIEAYRRKSREPETGEPVLAATCPSCGRPVKDPQAAFCSRCGAPLRKVSSTRGKKSGRNREDRNG